MLIDKVDQSKLTPMMSQYIEIKKQYRDLILFYRLGDFYEMFFDDALIAAKELELVLTGRDAGLDERVPMAGVPHHSSNPYINRLVEKGYKIGIVEQLEDPATAKGIVKRNVVKIVSPGTILDLEGKEKDNNFLLALYGDKHSYGISYLDITTGEFKTTEILNSTNIERDLLDFAGPAILLSMASSISLVVTSDLFSLTARIAASFKMLAKSAPEKPTVRLAMF